MHGGVSPASVASLIVVLTACSGTATHAAQSKPRATPSASVGVPLDLKVSAMISSSSGVTGGGGYRIDDLRGELVDDAGVTLAGSAFSEKCTASTTAGPAPTPVCNIVVNTGRKVYKARGPSLLLSPGRGTFKTVDSTGTVMVNPIVNDGPGRSELVLVTVRTPGR